MTANIVAFLIGLASAIVVLWFRNSRNESAANERIATAEANQKAERIERLETISNEAAKITTPDDALKLLRKTFGTDRAQ